MKQSVTWDKVMPIQSIESGCLINGNGDISVGFDLILPEIYTISEEQAKGINEGFNSLLAVLPANTTIQKLDFFYTSEYNHSNTSQSLIMKENEKYYDQRGILSHYSKIIFTFSDVVRNNTENDNSYIKAFDFVLKKPFKDIDKVFSKNKNIILTIENTLNTMQGITAKRMNEEKLGRLLYEYLNQSYGQTPVRSFREETLEPLCFEGDIFKVGNRYIKFISLSEEGPKLEVQKYGKIYNGGIFGNKINNDDSVNIKSSLVLPLGLGLPIDHVLSTVITTVDNQALSTKLTFESSKINLLATFKHKNAVHKQEDIKNYIDTVSRYNYQGAQLSLSVILRNTSIEDINRDTEMVKNAFINMNQSRCWVENADSANLFFATCPGNAFANYRKFITVTQAATQYLHIESQYYSDKKGYIFVDRYNSPCVIDLWDSKYLTNRNKIVIGPSGSGKSFLLNNIVNQGLYQGNHIVIVDIGHSYKRNCELNRGKYFDSSVKKNLSFNVFICNKDHSGKYVYNRDADGEQSDDHVNFVSTIISSIWKGEQKLINEEKAILKDMIVEYYENINNEKIFPDMNSFYSFIDKYRKMKEGETQSKYFDFDSIKLLLKPFIEGGEKSYLLNAKENIDIINDKFIVFDLEAIKSDKDSFSIISLIIIELVVQKSNRLKGVKKTLIVDEGLDFLEDEKTGDFIAYLYRTFRKKDGEIVLAAQNINFIKEADPKIKDSILINTDTKYLLDHSNYSASFPDLQAILSLTLFDIELLRSVKFKEFFIKTGNLARVYKNDVSDFAHAVYTSKQSEVKEINELYDEIGDLASAINQFVENHKK